MKKCICGHPDNLHANFGCEAISLTDYCTAPAGNYFVDCECSAFTEDKPMSEKVEFRVGDEVDWLGLKGKVVDVGFSMITVFISSMETHYFYADGSYLIGQTPSLKLISRPKKMVKKRVSRFFNLYRAGLLSSAYSSIEEAAQNMRDGCIDTIELKGEYEVEE